MSVVSYVIIITYLIIDLVCNHFNFLSHNWDKNDILSQLRLNYDKVDNLCHINDLVCNSLIIEYIIILTFCHNYDLLKQDFFLSGGNGFPYNLICIMFNLTIFFV